MITEMDLMAMQECYLAKKRALFWYQEAMHQSGGEEMLNCLFFWQYAADEATYWWRKIKDDKQIALTLISAGYGGVK